MQNKERIAAVGVSLLTLWVLTNEITSPRHSALAQSPTPIFTIVSTGNGALITDQTTGAITFCPSFVNVTASKAVPSDKCALLGRITPSSSASSLSVAAPQSSAFILNNQTGQILQCATADFVNNSGGSPVGDSCAQQGYASK
jgi:hypothetical protein